MKKSGKKRQKPNKKTQKQTEQAPQNDRRNFLKFARNGTISTLVLAGGGWWVFSGVQSVAREQDLSALGTGMPAIVQIHDPSCSLCTELQRQTRKALRCFEDSELMYKVANIRTEAGARFSAQVGQPHVTLVLLSGAGEVQQILQGVRQSEELKEHFSQAYPSAIAS